MESNTSQLHSRLLRIFHKIDTDGSGFIDKAEFFAAIENNREIQAVLKESRVLSSLLLARDFEATFKAFEANEITGIDFDEFFSFVKRELEDKHIREIFNLIDIDGNRYLTKSELVAALRGNAEVIQLVRDSTIFDALLQQEDWDGIFSAIDTDRSVGGQGKIEFPEFWKFCKRCSARVHAIKIKAKARKKQVDKEEHESVQLKELLSRLTSYSAHDKHCGSSGQYTASVLPDNCNFLPVNL